MSLVDYSSSDEDSEDVSVPLKSSPRKLLPNPLKSSLVTLEDVNSTDDHDGRVRSFAHERGIWATYVYISWPQRQAIVTLQNDLSVFIENCLPNIRIHSIEELHLSLSRTVVLRHHWIDEFTSSIKQNAADIKRFTIFLNSLKIYCNEELSRTFISIGTDGVESGAIATLTSIIQRIDSCLNAFNLPSFYEDPSFHVSLAWCVGNRKSDLEQIIDQLQNVLNKSICEDNADFNLHVDKLHCKSGNKYFVFPIN